MKSFLLAILAFVLVVSSLYADEAIEAPSDAVIPASVESPVGQDTNAGWLSPCDHHQGFDKYALFPDGAIVVCNDGVKVVFLKA